MSALLGQLEGRERRAECEKHDELERLRASHQRLKEALEQIASRPNSDPLSVVTAREALRSAP